MKDNIVRYNRYNSYYIELNIINNIKKLYQHSKNDYKNTILSTVAYDDIEYDLKKIEFKFTNKQFENAKEKRINNNFILQKYKRFMPQSKKN